MKKLKKPVKKSRKNEQINFFEEENIYEEDFLDEEIYEEEPYIEEEENLKTDDFVMTDDEVLRFTVEELPPIDKKFIKSFRTVEIHKESINSLVNAFINIQKQRIVYNNRIKAFYRLGKGDDNSISMLKWVYNIHEDMENTLKNSLESYVKNTPIGRWLTDIMGIGPILAAKLIYFFDVTKVNHYNQFHSYAGLNDNNRPWLGKEKSKKIVEEVMDKHNFYLNEVRFVLENYEPEYGDTIDDLIENIKDVLDLDCDYEDQDRHYRVVLLVKYLTHKKLDLSDADTVYQDIKSIVDDELGSTFISGDIIIKVGKTRKKPMSDFQIEEVSRRTQWSVSNLMKFGYDEKKGAVTEAKLCDAAARIPYNADLKTTCYVVADLFVKQSNKPNSLYGRLYKERKAYETEKNLNGDYAEYAAKCLREKTFTNKEVKESYENGFLIPGHIENRARRYAVKIFIAHLFEAMYYFEYGEDAPVPYPLAYLGHVDYIEPEVDFHDPKYLVK